MNFDKNKNEKYYLQIYRLIKNQILTGGLKPLQKVPSIRQLSLKYNVNLNTVLNAYDLLEKENLIEKIVGKGSFVSENNNFLLNEKDRPILDNFKNDHFLNFDEINFSKGTIDPNLFPVDIFKKFSQEILCSNNNEIFEYQNAQGISSLRSIASEILEKDDIFVTIDDILISSGTQQALNVILNLFSKKRKINIAVSEPTYVNALNLFKNICNIFPIKLDNEGWNMEDFSEILEEKNIDLVYEVFNFQNPTGIIWSHEKRKKLIELAFKHNFYIIEDDSFSDFYFGVEKPKTLKSLDMCGNERVFYVKTFSKIFMPGIGTAFIVAPKKFIEQLTLTKHSLDTTTSGYNQAILEKILRNNALDEHLSKTRIILKNNCLFMLKKLQDIPFISLIFEPQGGFFIWTELSSKINEKLLYENCKKFGINLLPSSVFFNDGENKSKIRFSFSSVSISEIEKGLNIFKIIIEKSLF